MANHSSSFLILLVAYLTITLLQNLLSPLRKVPGPWHTFLVNWPLKYYSTVGRRVYYIDSLHKRYGPIIRIAPGEISLASPAAYIQIYSHPEPGIFTIMDNKEHAARRKMFARAFTKSHLRSSWEPEIRTSADLAITRILEEIRENGKTDIYKWVRFMANDTSSELMFGDNFQCLERGASHYINDLLEIYQIGGGISAEFPFAPYLAKLTWNTYLHQMFNGWNDVLEFATGAVNKTRQQVNSGGGSKPIFGDVILRAEKNEQLADDDIRHEAGNFTVAGTDTTAFTLRTIIWAILSRPKIQTLVEEEFATLPENYTDAHVDELPFMNAVIKEVGRLYGVQQGWLPRIVPKGGALLEGYWVPQGTCVEAQRYTMNRDAKLFPNPLEFNPWRWYHESNMSAEAKLVFNPFGPGSRTCIGRHMAEMEIRLALAAFFRRGKGLRLAPETQSEQIEFLKFFATFPKDSSCIVTA